MSRVTGDTFRGHPTYLDGKVLRYVDNNEPTRSTWKDRPCGACNELQTKDDHDPCISNLPSVMNACCGHGVVSDAYVQFDDGRIVRGEEAIRWQEAHK